MISRKIFLIAILFSFFSIKQEHVFSAELERSDFDNIIYIRGNFDNDAAAIAKSYCETSNLNTFYFRTKDKKTYDVETFLFGKNKWRFFCANNFVEAKNLFDNHLNYSSFKSNLAKVDRSQIEGRFWRTAKKPVVSPNKDSSNSSYDNEGDSEIGIIVGVLAGLFALLAVIYSVYFKDKSSTNYKKPIKQKIIRERSKPKEHEEEKSKTDLINEWKSKRKKLNLN